MTGQVRLLKVTVQPVFVAISEGGDLEELVGQPIEVPGKGWSAFAATAFGQPDLDGIAQVHFADVPDEHP